MQKEDFIANTTTEEVVTKEAEDIP